MKLFFSTILLVFAVITAQAQPKPDYSVSNKKAIKKYEEALAAYDLRDRETAAALLKETIELESKFIEAYYMLAQVYDDLGRTDMTIEPLEQALAINEKFYTDGWLMLAESNFALGQYEGAEKAVTKYMQYSPSSAQFKMRATLILSSCTFAKQAIQSPVPFEPKNLGPNINTEMNEYYPCITADENVLLFTRLVNDSRVRNGKQEDFFITKKDVSGNWINAQPIVEINTVQNEGAPSLSADGQTLIFTACETADGSFGANRQGYGSCDLFFAMSNGNGWGEARNLGPAINSNQWESQPSFAADGKTMYFVRGKRSARGHTDQDIYYSYIMENGRWSEAKKVPGRVNTPFEEESVMIHPDGRTLYFSSNGHPGMGGLDIYKSQLQPNGEWGLPENLGYPINTFANENSIQVTASGNVALFASERKGGYGGLDLYSFDLYEGARPELVTYVKGIITDKLSFKKLGAKVELIDLETEKVVAETYSGSVYGDYLICIPSGKDYALNVSKDGYLFHSENFSLKNYTSMQPYSLDVALQKLKSGASIVLNNVFFETNKWDILPASKAELNKLAGLLNANPTTRVEISGHTDNVGNDESNMKLSQNRASAVVDYLVKMGIDASRLEAKGYGENQPIASNETEEGRAKNRRTEFKILD
ncbi:MAG: OmpA family protein [Flavobacteriales bacterium]